ncbi:hypothetical protein [Thermosulfidibacter takaii]|nr:hypothetical protein [Thermosulfidibacter takaii]
MYKIFVRFFSIAVLLLVLSDFCLAGMKSLNGFSPRYTARRNICIELKDAKLMNNQLAIVLERKTRTRCKYALDIFFNNRKIKTFKVTGRSRNILTKGNLEIYQTGLRISHPTGVKVNLVINGILKGSITRRLIPNFGLSKNQHAAMSQHRSVYDKSKFQAPDLVITSFQTHSTGRSNNLYHLLDSTLTIANRGSADVNKYFYIGFEYFDPDLHKWVFTSKKRVRQHIGSQRSIVITATVQVPKGLNNPVRVRAITDYPYEEFCPKTGRIMELREDNNVSPLVSVEVLKLPQITRISVHTAVRGSIVEIYGNDFGHRNQNTVVIVGPAGNKREAEIKSWGRWRISFRIPDESPIGYCSIYIARIPSLVTVSNPVQLLVVGRGEVSWDDVVGAFNLFSGGISVRLHTRGRGASFNNQSVFTSFGKTVKLDNIEKIEFSTSAGHYRYLIQDIRSSKITASKGNKNNQLIITIEFESQGTELKGYWQDLLRWGGWRDESAPDIEVDDAILKLIFEFSSQGGRLDYRAGVKFDASLHASNSAANDLMNWFVSGWRQKVKRNVVREISAAINGPDVKTQIIRDIKNLVIMKLGIRGRTISRWRFTPSAIIIDYR